MAVGRIGGLDQAQKIGTKVDLENTNFVDVKKWESKYAADLLCGQGVTIESENEGIETFLKDTLKRNNFDDLMLQMTDDCNYYGRIIVVVEKRGEHFYFNYVTPELFQNVSKFEIDEFRAEILNRKVIGLQTFFCREIYTTTQVIRNITVFNKDSNEAMPYDVGKHGELPEEFKLPSVTNHNLGFVPLIEFTNQPSRGKVIAKGGVLEGLADDYAVASMAPLINNLIRQLYKEAILGKTKLAGNFDESTIRSRGGIESMIEADAIIETRGGPGSQSIATTGGTFDGMKWADTIKDLVNQYFKGCGYSSPYPKESQQTEAESLYSKDDNQRTTAVKRRRWTEGLNDLFSKMLVYKGLMASLDAEREFKIEIKENVVYNRLQLVQFLQQAMTTDKPLMTWEDAISLFYNITDKGAIDQKVDELKKMAEDQAKKDMELMQSGMPGDGGGIGKAGPGQDPDGGNNVK